MKYCVSYQSRSDGQVFSGNVEIDRLVAPTHTDQQLIELLLKDSTRFRQTGLAGIEIVAIIPIA